MLQFAPNNPALQFWTQVFYYKKLVPLQLVHKVDEFWHANFKKKIKNKKSLREGFIINIYTSAIRTAWNTYS